MAGAQRQSRLALFLAQLVIPMAAFAQSATTQVTGTFGFHLSASDNFTVGFTCTGAPTCVGTYNSVERAPQCTNLILMTDSFSMTGLNLAQTGTIAGTVTLGRLNNTLNRAQDGSCTVAPGAQTETLPYTGTWSLPARVASITVNGGGNTLTGGLTADVTAPAPIFPMVVTSSIGPVTSTASATFQFRPQDVGQTRSVFTFASAPATRVQGGLTAKAVHLGMAQGDAKADPVACVLAQVNPAGQLVAVTAGQLQALSTGVAAAAGASAQILNNTPTQNVAGATFYVGYGSNGQAMLDDGIFRNAVLVPGNSTCPPLPYMTSLWWNPNESGWGLNLSQQGSLMFGTLFTYDASRAPLWLVMPSGALQADGVTFTGDLFRTTGPAFNANPFTPIGAANITRVGTMSVTFTHASAATVTYSINGVQVQKGIQRQVYGSRSANCMPTADSRAAATNYQDLWWNANESGWGVNVTHQDNTLFATLFTYDAAGRDLWLVMSGGTRQGDGSYFGDLFRTQGSPFNAVPVVPLAPSDVTSVGNMRLRFTDGNNGTLSYTFNGTTVNKAITRQVFSSPVSACN